MTSISYAHDPGLVIPISSVPLPEEERAAWARDESMRFGLDQALEADEVQRLSDALATERSDLHAHGAAFVAFDPLSRCLVVVRIAVLDRAIGQGERRTFLRPAAMLPGRLRVAESNSFGAGCSSAFPVLAHGGTGELRWLYVASDATLMVVAAPIFLPAMPAIGAIAEAVLRSVVVGDAPHRAIAADFDPAALVAESVADQPRWER